MTTATEGSVAIDWRTHVHPEGEHLIWAGPRQNTTPSLYIRYRRIAVRQFIYAEHHGRRASGCVTTSCDTRDCVKPEHLLDFEDRQARYLHVAEEVGRATTDGYCALGHPWTAAVFDRDGRRCCWDCRCGEPPVVKGLAVELALAGCPDDLAKPDELEVVRRAICVKGYTHKQAAALVERSPRTVTRWAVRHGWRKPT